MKYFRMTYQVAGEMQLAVWEQQAQRNNPLTKFHIASIGTEACLWTEDAAGELLLEQVLQSQKARYEEVDKQTVSAHLDKLPFRAGDIE